MNKDKAACIKSLVPYWNMKIVTFKNFPYSNDGSIRGWEVNFVGKKLNLRIAKYQFAFWINLNPVFNLMWFPKLENKNKIML